MTLVLIRKSTPMHPTLTCIWYKTILIVIINPMQPIYCQISINMLAYMITHVANAKANMDKITLMIRPMGGRKIEFPNMDDHVRRGKKRM